MAGNVAENGDGVENVADARIAGRGQGAVNRRILAGGVRADYRRIEAAGITVRTHFTSAEAKRHFVRFFGTLQLNVHFISVIARRSLPDAEVAQAEAELRKRLETVSDDLGRATDAAEALFRRNGITCAARYAVEPLELEVTVISAAGRRFLELLHQLDRLMPMLQTLEILEVIKPQHAENQRTRFRHAVRRLAGGVRRLAGGLRKRMLEVPAGEAGRGRGRAGPGAGADPDLANADGGAQADGDRADVPAGAGESGQADHGDGNRAQC